MHDLACFSIPRCPLRRCGCSSSSGAGEHPAQQIKHRERSLAAAGPWKVHVQQRGNKLAQAAPGICNPQTLPAPLPTLPRTLRAFSAAGPDSRAFHQTVCSNTRRLSRLDKGVL